MPLILGTNSIKDTGYDVANSLRFNDGSSDHLTRTPASAGNRKTFTFSAWCKFSNTSTSLTLFHAEIWSTTPWGLIQRQSDNTIRVRFYDGTNDYGIITNRLFRDVSAWYHIVVAVDTTQGTASNRIKLYVNGVQETSFSTENYPSQNYDTAFNQSSVEHQIGEEAGLGRYFDGYMAETVLIDGSQLDPTSFGEFDSDSPTIWKPKNVSGLTFGTNGFYLEFKQSGTSANSSGIGADTSGNDNHFTVNNLTAVDQSIDTCTNNFATMNPLILGSGTALSEGNLQITPSTNATGFHTASTMGVSTGKWYWEAKPVSGTAGAFGIIFDGSVGNAFEHQRNSKMPGGLSGNANSWGYKPGASGAVENGGSNITFSGVSATSDNILGFAMDLDNGALYIHKDGTYMNSGNPTSGASKTGAIDISGGDDGFVFPAYGDSDTAASPSAVYNFGSPSFAISSGNTDANGYGNFEYAPPSGYYALNTKNLAEFG